jgi:hypothetical protein
MVRKISGIYTGILGLTGNDLEHAVEAGLLEVPGFQAVIL